MLTLHIVYNSAGAIAPAFFMLSDVLASLQPGSELNEGCIEVHDGFGTCFMP